LVHQFCLPDLLLRIHQNFVLVVAGVGMTVGVGMFAVVVEMTAVAVGMIAVAVEMTVVAVGMMAVAEVGTEVVGQAAVVAVWLVVHFPG